MACSETGRGVHFEEPRDERTRPFAETGRDVVEPVLDLVKEEALRARERRVADKQLKGHDAQRPHVDRRAVPFVPHHLGRSIRRGPTQGVELLHPRRELDRHPKVCHLDLPVARRDRVVSKHQDVGELEIAVHDLHLVVEVRERLPYLVDGCSSIVGDKQRRHRVGALKGGQISVLRQLHHHGKRLFVLKHLERPHNVRVLQLRHQRPLVVDLWHRPPVLDCRRHHLVLKLVPPRPLDGHLFPPVRPRIHCRKRPLSQHPVVTTVLSSGLFPRCGCGVGAGCGVGWWWFRCCRR